MVSFLTRRVLYNGGLDRCEWGRRFQYGHSVFRRLLMLGDLLFAIAITFFFIALNCFCVRKFLSMTFISSLMLSACRDFKEICRKMDWISLILCLRTYLLSARYEA